MQTLAEMRDTAHDLAVNAAKLSHATSDATEADLYHRIEVMARIIYELVKLELSRAH
jgi:hypothetical protein